MKHERTGSEGKITLKPGEEWIVDQQCMIMHQGYLADWVGYFKGDTFRLSDVRDQPGVVDFLDADGTCTFTIDYGNDLEPSKDQAPTA